MRIALAAAGLLLAACATSTTPSDGGDRGTDSDGPDLSACLWPPPPRLCSADAAVMLLAGFPCDGFTRIRCQEIATAGVADCYVAHAGCAFGDGGAICTAADYDHCGSGAPCRTGEYCVSPAGGGEARCACPIDVAR